MGKVGAEEGRSGQCDAGVGSVMERGAGGEKIVKGGRWWTDCGVEEFCGCGISEEGGSVCG